MHSVVEPGIGELRDSVASGRPLVFFVGAGVSRLVGLPGFAALVRGILNDLVGLKLIWGAEQKRIAAQIRDGHLGDAAGRMLALQPASVQKSLKRRLTPAHHRVSAVHRHLIEAGARELHTTNYDTLLERAASQRGVETRSFTWQQLEQMRHDDDGSGLRVVHLHGWLRDWRSIVLGTAQYDELIANHDLRSWWIENALRHTIAYVGYGLSDLDLSLGEAYLRRGEPRNMPLRFALAPDGDPALVAEMRQARNIQVVSFDDRASYALGLERLLERIVEALHADRRPRAAPAVPLARTVGRGSELLQVTEPLASDPPPVVVLAGAEGVGKTNLACSAALAARGHYADGSVLIACGRARLSGVLSDLGRELDVEAQAASAPPEHLAALQHAVRGRQFIAVLDHLDSLDEWPQARPFPDAALLVTTRQESIAEELRRRWNAQLVRIGPMGDAEAATLLRNEARRRVDATTLLPLLQGVPLAVELAARLLRVDRALSGPEIAQQIQRSGATGVEGVLRACSARLARGADSFPAILSLFQPEGFSQASAAGVLGERLEALETLVQLGVLRHSDGWYQMHGILHEYLSRSFERLPPGTATSARRAFVDGMRHVFERAGPRDIAGELRNVAGASRIAGGLGDTAAQCEMVLKLLGLTQGELEPRGPLPSFSWAEAMRLTEDTLADAATAGRTLDRIALLRGLFFLKYWLGDHAACRRCIAELRQLLRRAPHASRAEVPLMEAYFLDDENCYWEAHQKYQRGLTLANQTGSDHTQLRAEHLVGVSYFHMGQYGLALERFRRVLERLPSIPPEFRPELEANTRRRLGTALRELGHTAEARQELAWVLEHEPSVRNQARALRHLGILELQESPAAADGAIPLLRRALRMFERVGNLRGIGATSINLAEAYRRLQEIDEAWDRLEHGMRIAQRLACPYAEAAGYEVAARIALQLDQESWSTNLLARAEALLRGIQSHRLLPFYRELRGDPRLPAILARHDLAFCASELPRRPAPSPVRAVAFDFYETLGTVPADAYWRTKREMSRTAAVEPEELESEWRAVSWRTTTGQLATTEQRVWEIFRRLSVDAQAAQVERIAALEREMQERDVQPLPGATDLLARLKQAGYRLALVVNATDAGVRGIERLGMCELFDTVLFSCRERIVKPDPLIYFRAAERLRVPPSEMLFVGDGNDLELDGAAAAGYRTARVAQVQSSVFTHLMSTSADYVLDETCHLETLLARIPNDGRS